MTLNLLPQSVFETFSEQCGFQHVTTSSYYPQANRFIERNVQTVKNILQKCKKSGADPHLTMLCLRTTPVDHHLPSPAELLNSREYQSNLPTMTKPVLFTENTGMLMWSCKQDRIYRSFTTTDRQRNYQNCTLATMYVCSIPWIENGNVVWLKKTPKSYVVDIEGGSMKSSAYSTVHRASCRLPWSVSIIQLMICCVVSSSSETNINHHPRRKKKTQSPKLRRSTSIQKCPDRLNL